jgi:hypothetical protein
MPFSKAGGLRKSVAFEQNQTRAADKTGPPMGAWWAPNCNKIGKGAAAQPDGRRLHLPRLQTQREGVYFREG